MLQLWPELHIVHGKPRHSQSQASVERANQDIENMLFTGMSDYVTTQWSEGLRFVQFMKNRSYHSGIKMSPYEALFGSHPKVGLEASSLPDSILARLQSEEELEEALSSCDILTQDQSTPAEFSQPITDEIPLQTSSSSDETCSFCDSKTDSHLPSCPLSVRKTSILAKRKQSKDGLTQQAKQRKLQSDRNFPNPIIGDTVRVTIPQFDRGKTDARNVLACILEVTENNFFKLGTQKGVLKQLYCRSQFQLCHEKFLTIDDVPTDTTTSIRS